MTVIRPDFSANRKPPNTSNEGVKGDVLELKTIGSIKTSDWTENDSPEKFFFAPGMQIYLPEKFYGESFKKWKIDVNNSKWQIVDPLGDKVEVEFYEDVIGTERKEWQGFRFFVKREYFV